MPYWKKIICLSNSRKKSGRCVAGKEIAKGQIGQWLRPVSARISREVPIIDQRYKDGTDAQLLDIVDILFEKAIPHGHQSENHLIDTSYYWTKRGHSPWHDMPKLADTPKTLWYNGNSSTSGINNRLSAEQATDYSASLYLIHVEKVSLLVGQKAPQFSDSKRAVRASFNYNGVYYIIDVTDPFIETFYLGQGDGDYVITSPYLCVSLAEEYEKDGMCYKLIASILTKDRCK
jgi:hypothetical protein